MVFNMNEDRKKLIAKIEKKYGQLNSEWVMPSGKVTECRDIKELAIALEKSQKEIQRSSDFECQERNSRIKAELQIDALQMRNETLVDRIESIKKTLKERVDSAIDQIATNI